MEYSDNDKQIAQIRLATKEKTLPISSKKSAIWEMMALSKSFS